MKKIKSMLQDAGIPFCTNGTNAVFNYILEGESVEFYLREEPRTGLIILNAKADISIDPLNVQDVTTFLNKINIGISFGTFMQTDVCNEVGFRDTLRIFGEIPLSEEFISWIEDCHSMFMTYAKVASSIGKGGLSVDKAMKLLDSIRAIEDNIEL